MLQKMKDWWSVFEEKHPAVAEWVRKGGLFLLFSYFVTFLKALLLMFLPDVFRGIVQNAEWMENCKEHGRGGTSQNV